MQSKIECKKTADYADYADRFPHAQWLLLSVARLRDIRVICGVFRLLSNPVTCPRKVSRTLIEVLFFTTGGGGLAQ